MKYRVALAAFLLASPAFAMDASDTTKSWLAASPQEQKHAAQTWAANLNQKFGARFKHGRRIDAARLRACISARVASGQETDTQLTRLAAECAVQQVGSIF